MKDFKQIIGAVAFALAALGSTDMQAAEAAPHKDQKSIEMYQECATSCESCATACLNEADVKSLVACVQMNRDCADMCGLCARLMARDSAHAAKACALSAAFCQACADECAKHESAHCKQCAEACQKCADEFKKTNK